METLQPMDLDLAFRTAQPFFRNLSCHRATSCRSRRFSSSSPPSDGQKSRHTVDGEDVRCSGPAAAELVDSVTSRLLICDPTVMTAGSKRRTPRNAASLNPIQRKISGVATAVPPLRGGDAGGGGSGCCGGASSRSAGSGAVAQFPTRYAAVRSNCQWLLLPPQSLQPPRAPAIRPYWRQSQPDARRCTCLSRSVACPRQQRCSRLPAMWRARRRRSENLLPPLRLILGDRFFRAPPWYFSTP